LATFPKINDLSQRGYLAVNYDVPLFSVDSAEIMGDYVIITFDDKRPRIYYIDKTDQPNTVRIRNKEAFNDHFFQSAVVMVRVQFENNVMYEYVFSK
jgi:hypothetical protein